jgi:hypothetical protein
MLSALAAGSSVAGKGESMMTGTVLAAELPLIDRVIPANLETATFALG